MLQIAGHKTYVLGTIIVLEVQKDVRSNHHQPGNYSSFFIQNVQFSGGSLYCMVVAEDLDLLWVVLNASPQNCSLDLRPHLALKHVNYHASGAGHQALEVEGRALQQVGIETVQHLLLDPEDMDHQPPAGTHHHLSLLVVQEDTLDCFPALSHNTH
jgi:hypothetical protein